MASNLFELLQHAWAVASTDEASVYGVEVALVTNTKDPLKQGRVKICFARLPGKPESDWARMAHPSAGPGRGFYWMPEVGDEVLVACERGQASKPYVLGALWNGKDAPMKDAYTDENTTRMIQTKSGHQVILSDKEGEEKIVIADKSGKRAVTFDVKAKKLTFEAGAGDIELRAEKKITLECEDLEIKTKKTCKLDVGTDFDLTVKNKGAIDSGSQLDIQASRVDLNPGGGPASALASLAWKAAQAAAKAAAGDPGAGKASKGGGAGGGAGGSGAAAGAGGGGRGGGGGNLASDVAPAGRTSGATRGTGGAARTRDLVGGGAGADAPGAAGAGAAGAPGAGAGGAAAGAGAAPVPGQIKVQVVTTAGKGIAELEFELTEADGTKHAGKTDGDGRFTVDGLPKTGDCTLDLPDMRPAPAVAPSVAGRVRFVEGGVKVKIGAASVVEAPPRVRRGRFTGLLFDTDKAFLRPEAMTGIKMLKKLYASVPDLRVLVSGHTDRVGSAQHNLGLSVDRADSVRHFLVDDAAEWMKWYAGKKPNSKQWGTAEDQQMLSAVKDSAGNPFYTGPINGNPGGATSAAIKAFQGSRLLDVNGKANTATRQALVEAYMQLDDAPLPRDPPLVSHGCGKTHPVSPEGAPAEEQIDRRVEVYLFEGAIDPAPLTPCPLGGCSEYKRWVDLTSLSVDLDKPPGALAVTVVDENGAPVLGAHVHASGPLVLDAKAGADGTFTFRDIVPGDYKVVADADGFSADDVLVTVPSSTGAPTPAKLKLKSPLRARLALCWKTADGVSHAFPENTNVDVVYADGTRTPLKAGPGGALNFPVARPKGSFVLELKFADAQQFLAVAPAGGATKDAVVDEATMKKLLAKGFRVFLLPKVFDTKVADFAVDGTLRREFDKLADPATTFGSDAKPMQVVLDPGWQFYRFEYFDRFFGHSDHGDKRVPVPPLLLDGWRQDPGGAGAKAAPDSRSNWMAQPAAADKAAHCIPWILQRSATGTDLKLDPKKMLLQFETGLSSFVVSKSKDERVIEQTADANRLQASAERLKLYDLPATWKSKRWFVRPPGGGGAFFEGLTDAQVAASKKIDGRLAFCLDDLVLLDESRNFVALAAGDRVAVFSHRFGAAADYNSSAGLGVHKPDAKKPYFSDSAIRTGNYLTDYPDWTRLVAAQGNLFQAFAVRSVDQADNAVMGARAAVRLVDTKALGIASNNPMPASPPARKDVEFGSLLPYFQQHWPQTNVKYTGPATSAEDFGRTDLLLLRCCDRDGDTEVGLFLHYFRVFFHFLDTAPWWRRAPRPPLPHRCTCQMPTSRPTARRISGTAARRWSTVGAGTTRPTRTAPSWSPGARR